MRKGVKIVLAASFIYQAAMAQQDTTTPKALSEVVVTGQYAPQPLRNSVYKIRTISAERIRMRAATDVIGVLNSELGIRFSSDNTLGESDTKIFGIGGSRVKVLIDGIPMVDRDATKQSLTQIDINSIEKIEIVDGPMSVMYGTDALAGVINIITKKGIKGGKSFSIAARVQEESIANTYSLFNKEGIHNENITLNWNNEHWKASGYFTRNSFGGFSDTAAFPAKVFKPKDQWMGGGTVGYRNSRINAWYRLDYMWEQLFAANPVNVNTYVSFRQYYITNRFTHQAQADWQVNSKLKVNASASFQDYRRNTESYRKDYRNATSTIDESGTGYWDVSTFKTLFFRATAAWFVSPYVSIQPGFDIKSDKTSGERIAGTPDIIDYSFFVSSELKPSKAISIRPGLRFSKNSVYDAPPVIPSINTKFTLSDHLDMRLSYARGFRAPILRELYFKFFDANHSIQGNPGLKAEHSNSYMLSFSSDILSSGSVKINSSLTGFYNDYSNFIDLYAAKDVNGADIFTYFNQDKYKNLGATFDNSITWKDLAANIGMSYIGYYNKYQEDAALKGDRSEFAWSPEINANLTYKIRPIKTDIGFYYKFTGKTPAYLTDADDNIVLSQRDAFHWADLSLSKPVLKYLTIQAGIRNLFDVKRLNTVAGASGGAHSGSGVTNYAYGRSYFMGINFQLDRTYK